MLLIRKEQIELLSKASIKNFEKRIYKILVDFFPKKCKFLGEEKVVSIIRSGIKKGEIYNISSERDLSKLIGLMLLFGEDFDIDPEMVWAGSILAEENKDVSTKIRILMDKALEELKDTSKDKIRQVTNEQQ